MEAAVEPLTARIPVNRNGATRLLAPREIYAVRADAHYTYVFHGTETHFCNHPLSETDSRLDPAPFMRVPRSPTVNLAHTTTQKRSRHQVPLVLEHARRTHQPT